MNEGYDKLDQALNSLGTLIASVERRRNEWLANVNPPLVAHCPKHGEPTELNVVESMRSHELGGALVYDDCEECRREKRLDADSKRLNQQGVPAILCRASFDNFKCRTDEDAENLKAARRFTRLKKGFLVMLGRIGAGKSHLAVAVMRKFPSGLFVKQSTLLYGLRDTYRDDKAENLMLKAKRAKLLVLDEIGVSAGGKDEFPMLHEILDHRHGEFLPTVLTGNVTQDELGAIIGPRLQDRLVQSNAGVLHFSGSSHRKNLFATTNE